MANWERLAQVDYGHVSTWDSATDIGINEYYNIYVKKCFNIMNYCEKLVDCGYPSERPFYYLSGGNCENGFWVANDRLAFTTIDGASYSIVSKGATWNVIRVDINGAKKPNKMGRDVFVFERTKNGIKPACYNCSLNSINSNCSKKSTGDYCAARIMKNIWEFDYNYPW